MSSPSTALPKRKPSQASARGAPASTATSWDLGIVLLTGVLLLTIFEGAARKWLFADKPALRYAAYFSKDALFVWAAYLGAKRGQLFSLSWFALCAGLVLLPSLFATMAHSNLVGTALSIRAYFVVPLCAFLAAPLVRGLADVERCAKAVVLASVVVAIIGVQQYRLPDGHWLNRYETGTEASASVTSGGHVRATGTFAYIAGMTVMTGIGGWAGMILALPVPGRAKNLRYFGCVAIAAALVCALVSMSRSALLVWGISVVGPLILFGRARETLTLGLAVAAVIGAFGLANPAEQLETTAGKDSLAHGMLMRITTSDTFADRLQMVAHDLWHGLSEYVLGMGLGLGQPGGIYASFGLRASGGTEFEWGRIAFEVGAAGLLGALLIRAKPAILCWQSLRDARDPAQRVVLAAALPFFGIMALGNMAFNHTGNSAAWLVMTFALSMVSSSRQRPPR